MLVNMRRFVEYGWLEMGMTLGRVQQLLLLK